METGSGKWFGRVGSRAWLKCGPLRGTRAWLHFQGGGRWKEDAEQDANRWEVGSCFVCDRSTCSSPWVMGQVEEIPPPCCCSEVRTGP